MIRLSARDGYELDGYLAQPAGSARGAVVVAQEMYGLNGYLRSVCDFDERAMRKSVPATRHSTYEAQSANGKRSCESFSNIGAYSPIQSFGAA